MRILGICVLACVFLVAGCSQDNSAIPTAATLAPQPGQNVAPTAKPGYEDAYYDGNTYTINAIEVPNHAPMGAQADLYEVVYPIGWDTLGVAPPQCNPCDHQHNGIDFTDYHDHVLDSVPSNPGHGEFSPLWHVWAVVPAYGQDQAVNTEINNIYAGLLPITSEDAVNNLLGMHLPGGAPVAVKIDAQIYFLCAVVNPHANN
jgi:hypothetical protein